MATPSLRSLLAERQAAAMVLARQAALRAVKRRIQKEGRIKLGSVPLSTLTRLGNDYLRKHPELLVEAAQPDIVDPTTKSLNETQVQNGA
jgi:hypothetical protein